MPGMVVHCDCGAKYEVPPNLLGKKVRCPRCGAVVGTGKPSNIEPGTRVPTHDEMTLPAAPPPLPPPLPESGAPSRGVSGESSIGHGLRAAAVNEASEKPERVWPVTWAAIIVGSGTALLVLWALVFRGGSAPQQPADKHQPPSVATQSAESRASAPAPQPRAAEVRNANSARTDGPGGPSGARPTELSAAQLYARSSPSVVTVSVLNERGQEIGAGSAFLLDESWIRGRCRDFDVWETISSSDEGGKYFDERAKSLAASLEVESGPLGKGCLVTNHHVIDAALEIKVTLPDGSRGEVKEVVTESEEMDLAVLFVEFISEAPLTTLNLADATPPVGSTVFAIGNPSGLANSLSEGIVSGYRDVSPRVRWLQTTAPISPGSSGGPLLLPDGRVTGVTTAVLQDGQNLNFAVPSVEVRRFLAQPFLPRELWEGRSYEKEEHWSYFDARGVCVDLENTFGFFRYGIKNADELLRVASAALPSIPKEHKYLAVHAQGRAHYELAHDTRRKDLRTAEEFYADFAGNPHTRQAVASFEQVVRERPDFAPAYAWLAKCRIYGGEWAEGLLAADSLVKLVPRCADAYMQRGECFQELERYNSALDDFQMVVELDPKNERVWNFLGAVYASLGENDKAIEVYETILSGLAAIDRDKQVAKFRFTTWFCYWHIGLAHERAGRFQQAIKFFELAKTHGMVRERCDDKIHQCRAKMR